MAKPMSVPLVGQQPKIPADAMQFIFMGVSSFQLPKALDFHNRNGSCSFDRGVAGSTEFRNMRFAVDLQKHLLAIFDDEPSLPPHYKRVQYCDLTGVYFTLMADEPSHA